MKKFSIMIAIWGLFYINNAMASGCDESCWTINSTTIREFRADKEFFRFEVSKGKGSLIATQKPNELPYVFPSPIEFKGTYRYSHIHPRLLERLNGSEVWSGTMLQRNVKFIVHENNGSDVVFYSGQLALEITFETGESITLFEPSIDRLVDAESGTVIKENLLPLFDL